MGGLFSADGKLAQVLGKAADLVILNVLWIVCSIPVVTAGAAAAAFYTVALKMIKNEESYVFRSFFQAFKENFKQATAVTLILLAVAAVLGCDFYVCTKMGLEEARPLFILFCVVAVFVYMGSCYMFPVMAFFENSTKKVFKNSYLMALAHLPFTILIAVISLLPWVFLFFGQFIAAAFFDLIAGFSIAGYINAHIFRRIFKRYIPE